MYIVEAMGGGVFTYIVGLTNQMVEYYDIYVAYAVRIQTPKDYRDYFDTRIHLIEVTNFVRSINFSKDFKAFWEIKRIAKKVKPDIIHLHSSKAGVIGRLAFNGKDIPLFYTPHGYSFLMQNHSVTKRMFYRLVEILCGKRRCITISCSEGEYYETLKLTKFATYINNGINIEELKKIIDNKKSNVKKKFTIFTLGRICYQKNPKLFNMIAKAMPDLRFVWIGDGELRSELTEKNIEITGWVERKEALKYSLQGDVFLLTSLWEGLPISLLEAMYMRKLCVVNDAIGNRNVIHTGYNGFVCREVNEFVYGIRAAQAGKTDILIENAYNDVIKKYNSANMREKYKMIYEGYKGRLLR